MARASLALLSYSCGSAFGSVTTLWTLAFDPPNCVAMLPQKFCPATTLIEPVAATGVEPPHAPTIKAITTHAQIRLPANARLLSRTLSPRSGSVAQEYCTIRLGKECAAAV